MQKENTRQYPFGGGIPVAIHGDITRKAELGARNSMDVVYFCAKFGGPVTGFAFGLIVFLSFWITIVFGAARRSNCRSCNTHTIDNHQQQNRSICQKQLRTIQRRGSKEVL